MKIGDVLGGDRSSTIVPRWDGKIVLAAIFIVGYYALIFRISGTHPVPQQNAQMIRDGMLVLGPAIGVIVGALFRTTGADERANARRSDELKTAIVTPSAIPAAPEEVKGAVEEGARAGSEAGVSDGLRGATAPADITSVNMATASGLGARAPAAQPYDGPPIEHVPAAPADLPENPTWPS